MLAGGILMGFGTLSIAYFILYAVMVDLNNVFTYFWLLLGVMLFAVGFWLFRFYRQGNVLPKWLIISAGSVCGAGIICFAVIMGLIIGEAYQQPKSGADYIIVLGARVRGDRISPLLKYRLDRALDYLSDNPDTMVVVSGGKGPGENLSEASAMQKYLLEKGISASRILTEDASLNTDQNIRNSIDVIENYRLENVRDVPKHIVVFSNGFHLFRATRLLKKQIEISETIGRYSNGDIKEAWCNVTIEGKGAPTKWYIIPNSYAREVFAVVKYKLSGQI